MLDILSQVAQFFLCLSILIVLHEGGHFLAARMTGTRVDKFYLFFDFLFPFPDKMKFSLWKKKIGDTEFGLGWFPMGGYVSIAGMQDETQDAPEEGYVPKPDEYMAKSKPQKLLIMLGGVIVNFILGFFLYMMILWVWGEKKLPMSEVTAGVYVDELGAEMGIEDGDEILKIGEADFKYLNGGIIKKDLALNNVNKITVKRNGKVRTLTIADTTIAKMTSHAYKNFDVVGAITPFILGEVREGSAAEKAKLIEGDSVVSINGSPVAYYKQFKTVADNFGEKTVQVGYYRAGVDSMQIADVTLAEGGKLGTEFKSVDYFFEREQIDYTLGQAIPAGFNKGWDFITTQLKAFGQMFRGKIKAKDSLGGFGSIGGLFPAEWNWHAFWTITAMLSLILAIMNLLPIPLLDGGYVVFLLFEMITGKEIPDKVMNVLMNIGLYLILALMIFANGMDILRGLGWA